MITIKAPGVFWRPPLTLPAEISLIHEVSDLFCGRAIGMLRKLSRHYAAAQKSGIFFCNKAVGAGRPLMNTINKEKMLFFQKMHYLSKKKCFPVFGPSKVHVNDVRIGELSAFHSYIIAVLSIRSLVPHLDMRHATRETPGRCEDVLQTVTRYNTSASRY